MSYHPVTEQIIAFLRSNGCPFRTFEHAPVRTSEEAARLRPEYTLHQGAKALIVKVKNPQQDKKFTMLVFPADLRFDSKRVKEILGVKEVSFATEEEVAAATGGVQVGGVPPFGNLFSLDVLADESLFGNDEIIFNAGDRSFSIAMKSADYRKLVNPHIASFASHRTNG